jgi:hypothetical protein
MVNSNIFIALVDFCNRPIVALFCENNDKIEYRPTVGLLIFKLNWMSTLKTKISMLYLANILT